MIKKSDKKNVKKCIRTNFNFYLCPNLYAMLVPTMTTEEVCKEIKNDYPAFYEKMLDNKASNYRKFIKAVLFPVIHQFSWKSSSGNMWNVIMLARYRNEGKCPGIVPYLKYENWGMGIIYPKNIYSNLSIIDFKPHFWKRYRERQLIPNGLEGISFDEQIKYFFLNSGLFTFDFREGSNKGHEGFVGYTKTGIFFGVVIKELDYLCVKTYVSANMLFDNQIESLDSADELREKILSHPDYFQKRGKLFHIMNDSSFWMDETIR